LNLGRPAAEVQFAQFATGAAQGEVVLLPPDASKV
jgi:hypothetical protein